MLSENQNKINGRPLKEHSGNPRLWALIRKKGKRDMANFKKAFGKDADFPSAGTIRKVAW